MAKTAQRRVTDARGRLKTLRPARESKFEDDVWEFVLENVVLPPPVEAWFSSHGGEAKPGAAAPLRLVSLDEAIEFALRRLRQLPADAHSRAAERLEKQHFASAPKQKFASGTEFTSVWTLALGLVVELRANGETRKLSDDFVTWVESLGVAR